MTAARAEMPMRRSIPLIAIALAGALAGCVSAPARAPLHETTLENGLRVIVEENHRAPVVVSQLWYRVGAVDEPDGKTGMSHMLEHMMFKGTARHPVGEFSRILAENGADENAFTTRDFTSYFQSLERSRLSVAFELEADRMTGLQFDPKEYARELEVVKEERRLRTEDEPESLTYERFAATAFGHHPYGRPVVGWMDDLVRLRMEDVADWYHRWYAPDNALLVVVGDVHAPAVFDLARRYFGPLPAKRSARPALPPEPAQTSPRTVTVRAPARVPYLVLGFHTPVLGEPGVEPWEPWALAVAAGILGGGKSARLQTRLVRQERLAADVGTDYSMLGREPFLFVIEANPAEGVSTDKLRAAIVAEVNALAAQPPADDELARVRAQIAASSVYERDSLFYEALKIGQLASLGLDPRLASESVERVRAVTAGQVQAVVRRYLRPEAMTAAVLEPQPVDGHARHR